jgi:cytochrome c oxidase cbb3-type subunit 3
MARGCSIRRFRTGCRRRWMLLLALLAGWVAGCDFPGRPGPGDRYVPPREVKSFDALFGRSCAGCHGADGKLGPAPPLNDRLFLAQIPDAELRRVIADGRHDTLMPAFATSAGGELTAEQVDILAEGIKKRWKPAEPSPSGAPSYLLAGAGTDGKSAGDPDEGLEVFAMACASCHGDDGRGGKSVGAINDPNFLALISDQALRRYVITGRPDLGMPDYADPKGRPEGFRPMSSKDVANVVALLAGWRRSGSVDRKGH